MIFVTTGTVPYPFKRLVDKSVEIFKDKKEKVIIQAGSYKIKSSSKNIEIVPFLPFEKTLSLYKTADLIISACGEVSVHLILKLAKNTPLFVPRLKKYGEHVDNQQEMIAKYIEKGSLAYVVYDIKQLKRLIDKPGRPNKKFLLTSKKRGLDTLIKNLHKAT